MHNLKVIPLSKVRIATTYKVAYNSIDDTLYHISYWLCYYACWPWQLLFWFYPWLAKLLFFGYYILLIKLKVFTTSSFVTISTTTSTNIFILNKIIKGFSLCELLIFHLILKFFSTMQVEFFLLILLFFLLILLFYVFIVTSYFFYVHVTKIISIINFYVLLFFLTCKFSLHSSRVKLSVFYWLQKYFL